VAQGERGLRKALLDDAPHFLAHRSSGIKVQDDDGVEPVCPLTLGVVRVEEVRNGFLVVELRAGGGIVV